MPTLTPRMGLEKPNGDEYVSRAAFNRNYDKIDAQAALKVDLDTHTSPTAQNVHEAKQIVYDDTNTALGTSNVQTAIGDLQKSKEDQSNKGEPNGYAGLDANGRIPLSQLPANVKEMRVITTIADRDALTGSDLYDGLRVHVLDASGDPTVTSGWAEYFYDAVGAHWVKVAENESLDIILSWSNLKNIPEVLNKLSERGGKLQYDGSLVFPDQRVITFIGGEAEVRYPWAGTVQQIQINCSEVRATDIEFSVEKQPKADYAAKLPTWQQVGGTSFVLPAGQVYKEYAVSASAAGVQAGDVFRASIVGDDTGITVQVTIQNN